MNIMSPFGVLNLNINSAFTSQKNIVRLHNVLFILVKSWERFKEKYIGSKQVCGFVGLKVMLVSLKAR